ncbi:MAG: phosphoglycerate dehydrogenase-like enzyme [Planctomycetota bacterium]|jgi:phosphoglycerate dehydrogenase-like enzyme
MATRPKIVYPDIDEASVDALKGPLLERLQVVGDFDYHLGEVVDDNDFCQRVGDANAVLLGWQLPDAVLQRCKQLELIVFTGTGAANHINLALAQKIGVSVCNTPGYADQTVAEHSIALMLAAARQIVTLDRETRSGGWNHQRPAYDLKGKTLGLIGLGGIGKRTATLAQAFGMDVIVYTANPSAQRAKECGVRFESLPNLLRTSDVVSIHLALNSQTEGLIGADYLALMPNNALLINTARAEIVDQAALLAELQSGRLAAGLDVFAQEPLAADSPFFALDNLVITPHTGYNTPQANLAVLDIAIGSVEAFYAGKPVNLVTA